MNDIWKAIRGKTCIEILDLYRQHQLSPVEVVKVVLSRIAALEADVNAFVFVDDEWALHQAAQSEQRWLAGQPQGLLDGIPATVKDLLDVKGWPTRCGSQLTGKRPAASEDAPAVARLREHGAILLGKTTTPEFGWKCVTDSPLTGTTRNPWNLALTPGGSSGGAAVAAALGFGFIHVGTDGGGSIRVPASMTGVIGFKPTYGCIPSHPRSHNEELLHVGPLTRTVSDSALMMTVMAQPDARDWKALSYVNQNYCQKLNRGVAGKKIAYCSQFSELAPHPEIADITRQAAFSFEQLGAEVEEIELLLDIQVAFLTLWQAALYQLLKTVTPSDLNKMDPGLVVFGQKKHELDLDSYFFALKKRAEFGVQMKLLLQKYDYLMTPTLPILPFEVNRNTPTTAELAEWMDWTPFSYPFNLSRQPAMSLPCGLSKTGLPIGLQIISGQHRDLEVLQAGKALETLQQPILADQYFTTLD